MKESYGNLLRKLKEPILSVLESEAVKFALKKLLGSLLIGGFRAWAIKFVVEHMFEELAKPLIDLSFRKIGYTIEVKNGEQILVKIANSGSVSDWDDATNSL